MSKLKELYTSIEKAQKTASINLDEIPHNTRASWGVAIRNAKDQLVKLEADYRKELLRNGVAIFLQGDTANCNVFSSLVIEDGEALVLDSQVLYHRLAGDLQHRFGKSRQFTATHVEVLTADIREVMLELGLDSLPQPRYTFDFLPTYDDVVSYIKTKLRSVMGDNFNKLYLENLVANSGLKIGYTGKYAPVIILNADPQEIDVLGKAYGKGSSIVTVSASDVVNKDFIVDTFKSVNKEIRKKNDSDPETKTKLKTKEL